MTAVRAARERSERASLHQLHGKIRTVVAELAELIDRDHSRVLELAADLCLFDEPAHQLRLAPVFLEQNLDRQIAAEVGIAPLEDRAHPSAGDLAQELVAVAAPAGCGHLGRRGPYHELVGRAGHRFLEKHLRNRRKTPVRFSRNTQFPLIESIGDAMTRWPRLMVIESLPE